MTLLRGVRLVA